MNFHNCHENIVNIEKIVQKNIVNIVKYCIIPINTLSILISIYYKLYKLITRSENNQRKKIFPIILQNIINF